MLTVFLIAGQAQAADYAAVSGHLADTLALRLPSLAVHPSTQGHGTEMEIHQPEVTLGLAAKMLARLETLRRRYGPVCLVTGQDIGTLQRLALSWARLRGCPTVLMPDGIVFRVTDRQSRPSSVYGWLRTVIDRAGLLAGDPVSLGGSNPDLILSWGEGWNDLWRAHAPATDIVVTGSPRADNLADAVAKPTTARVLICSQPLWHSGFHATEADMRRWYEWLAASASTLSRDCEVRIRLHPAEMSAPRQPSTLQYGVRGYVDRGPVRASLEWASHVVAPASTITLEGAALGRHVSLVAATAAVRKQWRASPLFDLPDWSRLDIVEPLCSNDLNFRQVNVEPYLANMGRAAAAVAKTLAQSFA